MLSDLLNCAPATHDFRPERKERRTSAIESTVRIITGDLKRLRRSRSGRIKDIVPLVKRHAVIIEKMSDKEMREEARQLGLEMRRKGFHDKLVARSFSLVREAAGRTLGMSHFDCQLIGGALLLKGMVAEMETGEGKTLTATLAAGTAALAGVPVHVISVNDYLTARDAGWMGPVYEALGLTVGCVTHDSSQEERRSAYQRNIAYCTNKEIVFDYLRDRMTLKDRQDALRLQAEYLYARNNRSQRVLLRGLHFAIVDEADSILIDEARTPLLISRAVSVKEEHHFMKQAMELADALHEGSDYRNKHHLRTIEITDSGKDRLRELTKAMGPLWTGSVRRQEIVRLALTARLLFRRDEHYLVQDGKIQIIDEFTGRVMPDRSWEQGLHQLIEIKEGCELSSQNRTLARISYQKFFRRYLHLSGMTGTAREVSGELWSVYGLPVMRVQTNRPVNRRRCPDHIFFTADSRWKAVLDCVRKLNQSGRPVLVGTRTVSASEHVSHVFREAGLEHDILNAKLEQEEAAIVARAGENSRITIATNMAGRGTDIKLGAGVAESGGLHVILTERHEAGRIDRQLAGRCGRQGDPGSYEAILSLDDPVLGDGRARLSRWLARRLMKTGFFIGKRAGKFAIRRAQKKIERVHAGMRKELLKQDEQVGDILSFSGRSE
jgi:preprotein translocase subunit SecA